MKKRHWIIIIAPLFLVWILDRVTKMWASTLVGQHYYDHFGFVLHHNHGAMLGLFSNLPPLLRVVSLSVGGAFLVFSYIIIQYLLPNKSLILRSGMSMLLGGILGNVYDRIVYGYVIDFLVFKGFGKISPVMNVADILQWFGYGMIIWACFKESNLLWPEQNLRKSYWVNPKFQLRYCYILSALGFAMSLIAGVFSYTYIRITLENMPNMTMDLEKQFLHPYIATFAMLTFGFCVVLFLVGLIISHRVAGPVYAFENYVKDLINDKPRALKLRAGDEFMQLEKAAAELNKKMKNLIQDK